jgi:hypothetical protein
MATLRHMVAQPNSWAAIRAAEPKAARPAAAPQEKTAAQDMKLELRR